MRFNSLPCFCSYDYSHRRAVDDAQAYFHGIVWCNHKQPCLLTMWFKVNLIQTKNGKY